VITPFIGPVADSGADSGVCNPMRGASVEREFVPTYVPEENGYSVPDNLKFQGRSDIWSRQVEILHSSKLSVQ
jgi:hypothetical protein